MNFVEYQIAAERTTNPALMENERAANAALGVSDEAGEVSGLVKKVLYQGHDFDRAKMVEELGDVLWYVAESCSAWGISLDEVAKQNIAKLLTRFPDKFDAERSRNRVEVSA